MIILPAKLSELIGSSKANSTGSSLANSSPGSTQTRQTSKRTQSTTCKAQTTWCKHGMLCGMRYVMHMQDLTRNDWTWPQLGNTRVPLERWGDFGWNRYKERRNLRLSEKLEHANQISSRHVYELDALKHDNKLHGRDVFKMLNKRLAPSHGQIIH